MVQRFVAFFFCSIFLISIAEAQDKTLTGREIALKVDAADTSYDSKTSATMTIMRGEKKLVRQILTYNKKFDNDDRKLIEFVKPSDVIGIKYLIWGYEDYQKLDDMWVFLPSEDLVRRISHGGMKSSFMRSDFANEDIEEENADDFDSTLLRSEQFNGYDCYVLEQIPRKKGETQYSKWITWVNKENWLHMKIKFYNKKGEHFKTAFFDDQKIIDGIWTTTQITMETPRRNSRTVLKYDMIRYNTGLSASLFDPAILKR